MSVTASTALRTLRSCAEDWRQAEDCDSGHIYSLSRAGLIRVDSDGLVLLTPEGFRVVDESRLRAPNRREGS